MVTPQTQQTSPSPLDIIVIGAGLSGLSTAISCALAGHNVVILEAAKELAEVREDGMELVDYTDKTQDRRWAADNTQCFQDLPAIWSL